MLVIMSVWAGVYTGSLALTMRRAGNRRGAVGAAAIALAALVLPLLFDIYNRIAG